MNELIKVEGLSKSFKLSKKQQQIEKTNDTVRHAVRSLSFEAYEGEIFGLLGPNGAGKTTTLRLLATLIKPESGDAFIGGCSIVNDPSGVRSKIGFLTSELKLEEFFTPNYLFDFFSINCRKFCIFDQNIGVGHARNLLYYITSNGVTLSCIVK